MKNGCVFLFLLPFAAVGLGMFFMIGYDLVGWAVMRSWKEVPAVIHSVSLDSNQGDDGSTYRVVATYEYEYEGKSYDGNRVSRYHGSDNIGSFHQDAYAELSCYEKSDQPFRCYVNPRDPSQSILYRNARSGMLFFYFLFAFVFGGVGLGPMLGYAWMQYHDRQKARIVAQFPGQPWMLRDDWKQSEVWSDSKSLKFSLAVVIPTSLLWIVFIAIDPPQHFSIGLVLLAICWGLLLWWPVHQLKRWSRFGIPVLKLKSLSIRPGDSFSANIEVQRALPSDDPITLQMECTRVVSLSSRVSNRTVVSPDANKTLWSKSQTVTAMTGSPGEFLDPR